jgi:hypothetical protein
VYVCAYEAHSIFALDIVRQRWISS